MGGPVNLSALVTEEQQGQWVAHCLEYPIFAFASNKEALRHKFRDMVAAYIHARLKHDELPFVGESEVPKDLQQLYDTYEPVPWMAFTIYDVRTVVLFKEAPRRAA